jgi:hypothetical protein
VLRSSAKATLASSEAIVIVKPSNALNMVYDSFF